MSCPIIKIDISKQYDNNGGGINPVYTYSSQLSVSIVSGVSSTPIAGYMELEDSSQNITTIPIYNPTNSTILASFQLNGNAFYVNNRVRVVIELNNGTCIYDKTIYPNNQSDLTCRTINYPNPSGEPSIYENCVNEFIVESSAVLGCTNPNSANYNPEATVDDGSCSCDCNVIELNVLREANYIAGIVRPVLSQISINLVGVQNFFPINGYVELTNNSEIVTVLPFSNPSNETTSLDVSFTSGYFYNNYKGKFVILLGSGSCNYEQEIFFEDLPCEYEYDIDGTISNEVCQDTFTIGGDIYGCTDPNSLNFNPCATIDDDSCEYPILSGCTDPNSVNYNPLAVIDDGSCQYVPVFTPILGCTNPFASNYNPNANFNDGSCIFISGCTNPLADNYNPNAVVDDGSCECSEADFTFNLNGNEDFFFLNSGTTVCDYYFEFKYRLILSCSDIIEYFNDKTDATILSILDNLNLYSQIKNDTSNYRQLELDINPRTDKLYFELSGSTEDCFTLKELIRLELGEQCPDDINDNFDINWRTANIKVPANLLNTEVKLGMFMSGFGFGGTKILLDDVKLYKVCYTDVTECVIIPYNFGFDLELIEDNIKATYDLDTNKDILNTKELTLRVDIPNYVKTDVVAFLKKYEDLFHKIFKGMSLDKIEKEFLPVRNLLTSESYYYYCHLYELYLNSFDYCSAKSKELDYEFMFKVLSKVNNSWLDLIKQVIPETVIWKDHHKFYSNFLFHQQKFQYKNYVITYGADENEVIIDCEPKAFDLCDNPIPYVSKIDQFYRDTTGDCLIESFAVPTNISESNYGAGRFLQYDKTTNEYTQRYDYPNQNFEICI